MNKIYTYYGDSGDTKTLSGAVIRKDDIVIHANGEIDSLQAQIDRILVHDHNLLRQEKLKLHEIQKLLWQLGGEISQQGTGGKVNQYITFEHVKELERRIDAFQHDLKGFVRFSKFISVDVNEARIRTRTLERTLTDLAKNSELRKESFAFINRLSDYFFALAVYLENGGKA